jgi:hypothetical protein
MDLRAGLHVLQKRPIPGPSGIRTSDRPNRQKCNSVESGLSVGQNQMLWVEKRFTSPPYGRRIGGAVVQLLSFLTSALYEGERLISRSGRFTHCIGNWMGH